MKVKEVLLICVMLFMAPAYFANDMNSIKIINKSKFSKLKPDESTAKKLIMTSAGKLDVRLKKNELLSILLPWLYFMSTSINIPVLPNFINSVINNGDVAVSPKSAEVYGMLSAFDSLFTFLSVNAVGVLSDKYGRKPFMIYSSLGLGTAYLITSLGRNPWHFYAAGSIDGCSS